MGNDNRSIKTYDPDRLLQVLVKIRHLFKTSPRKLILSFIDVKDNLHVSMPFTNNPCLILFKDGSYQLLPSGIAANGVKRALGAKYSRIAYWTVLPSFRCPSHPLYSGPLIYPTSERSCKDIYYEEGDEENEILFR